MPRTLFRKPSAFGAPPKDIRIVERTLDDRTVTFHVHADGQIVWVIVERRDGSIIEVDPRQVNIDGYKALLQETC